jgi:small subunit ribosomal protein S16
LLVIRLARTGRNKYPTYRIVAAESKRTATGKFVAVLGHYNPHTKDLVVKREDIQKHLANGAQPSNTVIKLLIREKLDLPKWVKLQTKVQKNTPVEATEATKTTEPTEVPSASPSPAAEAEPDATGAADTPAEAPSDEAKDTSK